LFNLTEEESLLKIDFKEAFVNRYKRLLGPELDLFLLFSRKPMDTTIRINTIKIEPDRLISRLKSKGWVIEQLPWYPLGLRVKYPKVGIGKAIEHRLGYFYVQGPASMIPPIVLDPKPGEIVLDMASAPGSKATQIAAMMENRGVLIANDVNENRIIALSGNLQRCGATNVIITKMDARRFSRVPQKFDKILLDAPCTGDGTIRLRPFTAVVWNERNVYGISKLQMQLILSAYDSLVEGGTLVYSTCTLAPEENEGVIDFLLQKRDGARIESFSLPGLKMRPGITEWADNTYSDEVRKTARIYPQDNDTEGFYIAKVIKEW